MKLTACLITALFGAAHPAGVQHLLMLAVAITAAACLMATSVIIARLSAERDRLEVQASHPKLTLVTTPERTGHA